MQPAAHTRPHHPAFDTCKDVLGMDLYRRNAFRILGLSVDASLQSAAKNQKLREMQQKLGISNGSVAANGNPLPLPLEPDAATSRYANESLQDPVSRFVHGFFWFWPTDTNTPSQGSLSQLSTADAPVALRSWQQHVLTHPDAVIVQHNIAVLAHALALDYEVFAHNGPLSASDTASRWSYWTIAHEAWRGLSDAPVFWQRVKALRDTSDDPRLPMDIAHRLRDWLPEVILTSSVRSMMNIAALGAAEGGLKSVFAEACALFLTHSADGDVGGHSKRSAAVGTTTTPTRTSAAHSDASAQIGQHLRAIAAGGWSTPTVDKVLEAELKPAMQELRNLAIRVADATPSTPREELATVLNALSRRAAIIEALLPNHSVHRGPLVDTLAEAILEAGIAHGNADNRWSHWLSLNTLLSKLATGAVLRDRLAKTGETLRVNATAAQEESRFAEAKNDLRAGMAVDVEVSGQGMRVPQVCSCCLGTPDLETTCSYSWQEHKVLQRVNRTVSFKFPFCRGCAAHESEASRKGLWLVVLPALGAGLLGLAFSQIEDANGWAVAGGSTAVAFIGLLLLSTKLKLCPLEEKHACRKEPVSLYPADAHKDLWRLTFANPVYAHAFAQANGFRKGSPKPSGQYRGHSLLGGGAGVTRIVVMIVLSMIASGIAFGLASGDRPSRSRSSTPSRTYTPTPTWTPPAPQTTPTTTATPRPSAPIWQTPPSTSTQSATKSRLAAEIESGKARLSTLEDEVATLERRLKSIQSEIDSYKSEIEGYESRARFGGYVNQSAYKAAIESHNESVESYNSALARYKRTFSEYEDALRDVNSKVDEYNRLIRR